MMTGKHVTATVDGIKVAQERWNEQRAHEGRLTTVIALSGAHVRDDYEERLNRLLRSKLLIDPEAVSS